MEEVQNQDRNLLDLPLEMLAGIVLKLPTDDRIRLSLVSPVLAEAVFFVGSLEELLKKAVIPFKDNFNFDSLYTALISKEPSRIVKSFSEKILSILGWKKNVEGRVFTEEQAQAVQELHLFYKAYGGQASLELMEQTVDEVNKRKWRAELVQNSGECVQGAIVFSSGWGTISWIGFGCCCPGSACCCGISIALSSLCGVSVLSFEAIKYEKEHNVFRSRFFDVEYDLELHAGNNFQSVLPPRMQMEIDQDEVQPMLVEQEQQPSCFSGFANFFRIRARVNLAENDQEMAVILNP